MTLNVSLHVVVNSELFIQAVQDVLEVFVVNLELLMFEVGVLELGGVSAVNRGGHSLLAMNS